MKLLIRLADMLVILIIGSCFSNSKEVDIADLKWGMSDAEIHATVKGPDSIFLFGEKGSLKIATGEN